MDDEAALKAVNDAGPYPPIPDVLNKSYLKFKIPIYYTRFTFEQYCILNIIWNGIVSKLIIFSISCV